MSIPCTCTAGGGEREGEGESARPLVPACPDTLGSSGMVETSDTREESRGGLG